MTEDGKKLDDKTLEGITGGAARRIDRGKVTVKCPVCGVETEVVNANDYICTWNHHIVNGALADR